MSVYEEDKKRGECKMGVVESLVKGRDDVVSGANIKVLSRGKDHVHQFSCCAFLKLRVHAKVWRHMRHSHSAE